MVIGWSQGVNRITLIDYEGKRHTKKLGVKGINKLSDRFYTYYDIYYQVHIIDMDYAEKLLLYRDKELICEITRGDLV